MSYPTALKNFDISINSLTTLDIRGDSRAEIIDDFLNYYPEKEFDLIITNPPFNIALDVIKHSLELIKEDGMVIMLLRLNFFGSKERRAFFDENMPVWSFVHTKRMKFVNTGGTDSIEYMHAVWKKSNPSQSTILKLV